MERQSSRTAAILKMTPRTFHFVTDSFKQKILSRKVIGKLICAMGSVMDASPFFTASAIKIVIPETNRPERHP
jgi:hypothetical protein